MAVDSCGSCGKALCEAHGNELPATPAGISSDAAGHFSVAVRLAPQATCASCRAEVGLRALHQAVTGPRAPLPAHWLDRAMALSSDSSRSDLEKAEDAQLPSSLNPNEVAQEFLRRVEQKPRERVPVSAATYLHAPDYVEGWTVDCRRTEYTAPGDAGRRTLPALISVHGELLGPVLEDGDSASPVWWILEEGEVDLQRLVAGVANLLMLSAFVAQQPHD